MFALDVLNEDLEMGIIGDRGMLMTRISQIEILQWKRGTSQKEPIIHKTDARHGEGWGNHLGFDEIHREFVRCILEKGAAQLHRWHIAAEQAIKLGRVMTVDENTN